MRSMSIQQEEDEWPRSRQARAREQRNEGKVPSHQESERVARRNDRGQHEFRYLRPSLCTHLECVFPGFIRAVPRIARMMAVAILLVLSLVPPATPRSIGFSAQHQRVYQLLQEGRYPDAATHAERLFVMAQSMYGPHSHHSLTAADLTVEARVLNGDGSEELQERARRIVAVKEAQFGGMAHEGLADSLRNWGVAFVAAGEYQEGYERLIRAVGLIEQLESKDLRLRLAAALTALGDAEIRTERYDDATRTLDRALTLRQQALGPEHPLVAYTLERKAYLSLQIGAYRDARADLERARAIAERHAPVHPQTALLLNTVGNLAWFEGNITESEHFHRRAVQLANKILPRKHSLLGMYHRDLAQALWDLGSVSEARDMQTEALKFSTVALGKTHPEVAWELTALGNYQLAFGAYADARDLYEKALDILIQRFGPTHLNVATILHNLALVYVHLGDYTEAERQSARALEIWQGILGPAHPYVGRAIDSLAEVFGEQGRTTESRMRFEQALHIREKVLGSDHRDVAETLTKLAVLLHRIGDNSAAEAYLSRAMRIWRQEESSGQSGYDGYGVGLELTGKLQLAQGDYLAARRSFEMALAHRSVLLGATHPESEGTKVGLASVGFALGETEHAIKFALQAEEASREHLRLTSRYLSESDALNYASSRQRGLDLALSFSATSSEHDAQAIFDSVVRSRALVLEEMFQRNATILQMTLDRGNGLISPVIAARQRFASLLVRGSGSALPQHYRDVLEAARREMQLAERKLAAQSAEFRTEQRRETVGALAVKHALPQSTALISFVRYHHETPWRPRSIAESAYGAFGLRKDAAPRFIRIGSAVTIDRLVQNWRTQVTKPNLQPAGGEQDYIAVGKALRRAVWDALIAFVGPSRRVFIVPDGALNLVSFGSLPRENGTYLIEVDPVLHYLAAERDLAAANLSQDPGKFVAIGGAAFDDQSVFEHIDKREMSQANLQPSDCVGLERVKFESLPGTNEEVHEILKISRRAGSMSTVALVGRSATEAALRRMSAEIGILHLATHGFFRAGECSAPTSRTRGVGGVIAETSHGAGVLRLSGLALAGANHRRVAVDADDGILTAEEVANLDLRRAQWVVLSACDTGIGEIADGEGILGLRRAFRIAGARTLIMSLWSVDDDATLHWMRALYENRLVRRLDSSMSAREAALTMLRLRRTARQSTHPFYWGSFVVVGDWV